MPVILLNSYYWQGSASSGAYTARVAALMLELRHQGSTCQGRPGDHICKRPHRGAAPQEEIAPT